jgi:hypothetical protein
MIPTQRLSSCLMIGLIACCGCPGATSAADPCRSGLPAGQRPGPYAALVATGPQRGQPHCFICETADRPAVIVFARNLSDPLGKLVHELDVGLGRYRNAELRAWVTFLSDDQTSLDPKVVKWGQKHATGNVPLAVFEDLGGPPSYRLAHDADVTILLSVRQRVVANFAFRPGELTEAGVAEVLRALPQIVGAAK